MNTDEIYFCYKCGELSPEYHVKGYSRMCQCGEATVITLTEAINMLNEYHVPEDLLDEEYDDVPLNFDEQDMSSGSIGIDDDE